MTPGTPRSEQTEKAEKTQLSDILEKGVGRDEVPEEAMWKLMDKGGQNLSRWTAGHLERD